MSVNNLGNGTNNNPDIMASLTKCEPKSDAIDQPTSNFVFINPDAIFHVKYIIVNVIANGIITPPRFEYMYGNIRDMVAITDENIPHVQHDEKNCNASFISTGATVRYIENPATAIPAAASNQGIAAPTDSGKNDKNTIKNFFNLLISFNYITILSRCDINQIIKCRIHVFCTE